MVNGAYAITDYRIIFARELSGPHIGLIKSHAHGDRLSYELTRAQNKE